MTAPHSSRSNPAAANPAGPHPGRKATADADLPIDPPRLAPRHEPSNPPDQRDSKGRFAPGNKGGPGNPFARKTAALRQAMLDAVTADDLQAIVRQLIQKAKEGDVSAARLVLSYAIGKPDRAVDPDTLDVQEWQQFQHSAVPNPDLLGVLGGLQAPLACTILRAALPHLQEAAAQGMAQQLKLPDPAPDTSKEGESSQAPGGCRDSRKNAQTSSRSKPNGNARPERAREKPNRGAPPVRPADAPREPIIDSVERAFLDEDSAQWQALLDEIMGRNGHDPQAHPPIAPDS